MTRLLLVFMLLAVTPASAVTLKGGKSPVTLDFEESFFIDYHTKLDNTGLQEAPKNIVDLTNRLSMRLRWKALTVGLRLDAALFPNAPTDQFQSDIRPEQLFVTLRTRRMRLTIGDSYVQYGRGIALSLRKLDDLGFDMTLRGLHFQWRNRKFNWQVNMGLTNVVNVDGVEKKFIPDPHDVIFGTRVEGRPAKWLRLGAHFVDIERRHSPVFLGLANGITPLISGAELADTSTPRAIRSMIAGANLELTNIARMFSFYAEYNTLLSTTERDTLAGPERATDQGHAFYSSATFFLKPVTILLEAKHYDQFDVKSSSHPQTALAQGVTQFFPYISPPTLERIDQRWQNNTNVTGGHLRVDYRLPVGNNRIFLSGAFFQNAPGPDEYTLHTYLGWEHRTKTGSRYKFQAGVRIEESPDQDLTPLRMVHIDADLYMKLKGPHDLQLHISHEFREKYPGQGALEDSYLEGTTYLSWNFAPHWSFTIQFEYLTDKTVCGEDGCGSDDEWYYPGAFVQYRFTSSSFIRLFGGRGKGGLKCSGGVCRIFPDFEGVKMDATVRF